MNIVQKQLEAYNARAIEDFMACFDSNAEIFELGQSSPSYKGSEEIRERYQDLFLKSPNLYAHVLNRTQLGNIVIDYEQIHGRMGVTEIIEILAIYQIENNLIRRVYFARKS